MYSNWASFNHIFEVSQDLFSSFCYFKKICWGRGWVQLLPNYFNVILAKTNQKGKCYPWKIFRIILNDYECFYPFISKPANNISSMTCKILIQVYKYPMRYSLDITNDVFPLLKHLFLNRKNSLVEKWTIFHGYVAIAHGWKWLETYSKSPIDIIKPISKTSINSFACILRYFHTKHLCLNWCDKMR